MLLGSYVFNDVLVCSMHKDKKSLKYYQPVKYIKNTPFENMKDKVFR